MLKVLLIKLGGDVKFKAFLLLSVLIISFLSYGQEYSNPESAVFDPGSNRYFISNFGNGTIIQIDSVGVKTYFKKGFSRLLGMIIYNNVLYVVENPKKVRGFDITNGKPVMELKIEEAQFLNDITVDDSGFLYVTDSRGAVVFKIDITNQSYSLFIKTISEDPNGIIYDKFNNRLLVCHFRENAQIDQVNLKDTSTSTVALTGFDNLDGITLDESGNCYVSSWSKGNFSDGFKKEGVIIKYDNLFKQKPEIIYNGLLGPADIYFNMSKNELVVPLFLENDVMFLSLKKD